MLLCAPAFAGLVTDVRVALAQNDISRASQMIRAYRAAIGTTPEALEAMSWVARAQLDTRRRRQDASGRPDTINCDRCGRVD
jgi:hypothetical protein